MRVEEVDAWNELEVDFCVKPVSGVHGGDIWNPSPSLIKGGCTVTTGLYVPKFL